MLVTGSPGPQAHHHHHHHHRRRSGGGEGGTAGGSEGGMGFLRAPHHRKVPSPLSESISERFSTILDHCHKKIRLLQAPSSLFNNLVTKARRKERDNPASLEQEHKLYLEEAVLERKIPETDLRQLVNLPPGLGYEEWLASHTIDFFQHINLLYGTVCEYCTMSGCPDMNGPTNRQYLWFDEKGKKTRVAAPQYVDYVMTFTQKTINDESIFPTKFENDFPVSFESIVKKIHRLLFHVVSHIYHSHFREMVLLNLHAHLNCIFAHFVLFNEQFGLIDEKETEVLLDLVIALKLHPEREQSEVTSTATTSTTTNTLSDSSCSQLVGLECSGAASNDTNAAADTIASEREYGTCSSSQDQESSTTADSGAVGSESSSGVLAPADGASAATDTPLLDSGAVLDTRP